MKKNGFAFSSFPKDYTALCRAFLPRPIRDAIDYANTCEIADAMAPAQSKFTADRADYFELLCNLIEDYDQKRVPSPDVSGREALAHLLEEHNLTSADLSRLLGGSRNLGSMILRGDRNLSVNHIRRLAPHFRLSADVFLRK